MKKLGIILMLIAALGLLASCASQPATPAATATPEVTDAPTEAPTEEPTEAPTEAPTEEPTEAPTEEPTEAPAEEEATEAPAAEETTETEETAEAAAKEYNTVEAGKFIYATSPDFPPFESRDDSDNVIGIEPDLIAIICERLGLTPEPYPIEFTPALAAPNAGTTDAVVSGVTIKEDRKASLDFTIPYVTIKQAIVSKAGSGITMDNIGEYTIGVQDGTTGHQDAVDDFGEEHVVAYGTYALVFQALVNGQVDCVLLDDMVGQDYVKRIADLEITETTYEPEEFGFGFAKDKYPELLADFNTVLQELIDDGTVESIILKWNE